MAVGYDPTQLSMMQNQQQQMNVNGMMSNAIGNFGSKALSPSDPNGDNLAAEQQAGMSNNVGGQGNGLGTTVNTLGGAAQGAAQGGLTMGLPGALVGGLIGGLGGLFR
jgi:hypothetical protein